jgi:hypothetical protein
MLGVTDGVEPMVDEGVGVIEGVGVTDFVGVTDGVIVIDGVDVTLGVDVIVGVTVGVTLGHTGEQICPVKIAIPLYGYAILTQTPDGNNEPL